MANYFLNPYPTQTDDFNHRKEIGINQFLSDDKNQEWMIMMTR